MYEATIPTSIIADTARNAVTFAEFSIPMVVVNTPFGPGLIAEDMLRSDQEHIRVSAFTPKDGDAEAAIILATFSISTFIAA